MDVRAAIRRKGDTLRMIWGKYDVEDSFYVPRCFHCQGLGHTSKTCQMKDKKKICRNCSMFRDDDQHVCVPSSICCVNCKNANRTNTNHPANDKNCPILLEKIQWIKSRTDDDSS